MGLFGKKKVEEKVIEKKSRLVTLIILDGFGVHPDSEGNTVLSAKTPFLDTAWTYGRSTLIHASGTHAGLPAEEAGNSEVGHLNLGAGQVVYQSLPRINDAISSHELDSNPVLSEMFKTVKSRGTDIHLVGVLSAAGVHGHIKHLFSLMEMCRVHGFNPYIHVMLDGRDTPPKEGFFYLSKLKEKMKELGIGRIASIMGRYYGMDRDNRWDRVKLAYDSMVGLSKETFTDPIVAIQEAYGKGEDDQMFVPRTALDDTGKPVGVVKSGDGVIFWNFREDRARELTKAFVLKEFDHFPRRNFPENLYFATMTGYEEGLPSKVIFPPQPVKRSLAETLEERNLKQLHVSETEKYMHVTYFFNGGIEKAHTGEDFFNIPSPRVNDYAMVPAMSAEIIRDETVNRIRKIDSGGKDYSFVLVNFANPDMLGHTGNIPATVRANEIVDGCTADIVRATLSIGGSVLITADHGNCETMINRVTKEIDIAHTNNPVPFTFVSSMDEITSKVGVPILKIGTGEKAKPTGLLADVAPTVLSILGEEIPSGMTGMDLLRVI